MLGGNVNYAWSITKLVLNLFQYYELRAARGTFS
jgi:hypothetical protein